LLMASCVACYFLIESGMDVWVWRSMVQLGMLLWAAEPWKPGMDERRTTELAGWHVQRRPTHVQLLQIDLSLVVPSPDCFGKQAHPSMRFSTQKGKSGKLKTSGR